MFPTGPELGPSFNRSQKSPLARKELKYHLILKSLLLITFVNSRDPCVAKLFETLMVLLKEFFEKVDSGKKSADDKKHAKLPIRQS